MSFKNYRGSFTFIEVPVYVLRYWETKFKDLKPIKKKRGSRYYSQTQIDLLKKIKYLLYEKINN